MKRLYIAVFLCTLLLALWSVHHATPTTLAAGSPIWPQWGQNPQHTGSVGVAGQALQALLADKVYDPLVSAEQAANGGELLAHYQVPILDGDDVFMESKTGDYSNPFNSQSWHQNRFHWESGSLVLKWTFDSDWKPEPINFVGGWEPVYHAVLVGNFVYDPGAGGTIFKLNRADGTVVTRINPFDEIDPNRFVAGPLVADSAGNVYYNVLHLNASDPFKDVLNSWLIKVSPDGTVHRVSYHDLVPDAPTTCFGVFNNSQLPWPPSPTAVPPTLDCGSQRPGVNVAPAIAPDGTIYTVSRAHFASRYSFLIAVTPDLRLKWDASLRDRLNDGCGVLVPIAPTSTSLKGNCRNNANVGVDPATNQKPAGRVIDQSSSSPTVLPDGSVLYGAYTRYNVARGHLFKFSSAGAFLAAYDFGWDSTPAVFSHDNTYSIVIKDNHYDEELGFYCSPTSGVSLTVCAFTGIPAGPFYITQLNASLVPEWKAHSTETNSCSGTPGAPSSCVSDHPNGFEWCINAPAIDVNGNVYVESEDGNAYRIPQGQTGVFDLPPTGSVGTRFFLQLALGAAYTPLSIGADGKIYTENDGHMFVVGNTPPTP